MRAGDLVKLIEKKGWIEVNVVGSHHHYKNEKGERKTFAFHSKNADVDPITTKKVKKQFGI